MNPLCDYLAEHGLLLIAGATGLLSLGALGILLQRSPIHRQRAGELAVLAILVWAALAVIPLPRIAIFYPWVVEADVATPGSVTELTAEPMAGQSQPALAANPAPSRVIPEPASGFEMPSSDPSLAMKDSHASEATASGSSPMQTGTQGAMDVSGAMGGLSALAAPGSDRQAATGTLPAQSTAPEPDAIHSPPSQDVPEANESPLSFAEFNHSAIAPWIAAAYLLGVAGCIAWLALGRLLLIRLVWSATAPPDWLEELFRGLAPPKKRRARLLVSQRSTRALSFGLWRPTVLLPASACDPRRAEAIEHVLLHELAHVRQRDAWGQGLLNLAFPLLFFHPLYWWIRRQVHLAAELIADDQAAAATAKDSYVHALIDLARDRARPKLVLLNAHGMSSSPSQFYRRMAMLLARNDRLASRCSWRWRIACVPATLLAVGLLAATLGAKPTQAQESSPAQEELTKARKEIDALKKEKETLQKRIAELDARFGHAEAAAQVDKAISQRVFGGMIPNTASRASGVQNQLPPGSQTASTTYGKPQAEAARNVRVFHLRYADYEPIQTLLKEVVPGARIDIDPQTHSVVVRATEKDEKLIAKLLQQLDRPTPEDAARKAAEPATSGTIVQGFRSAAPQNPPGAGLDRVAPDGLQLDLVTLGRALPQAMSELKVAEFDLRRAEEANRKQPGAITPLEMAAKESKVQSLRAQTETLRILVESMLKATVVEIEVLKNQLKAADAGVMSLTESSAVKIQLARAEARQQVLQSILQSWGHPEAPKAPLTR